ncbi:hypothetical protein [Stygiolobus caldivivus]|uniref:Uncharacterized protein n=1 Tax=Stygiolobus caldivivus TaxID=2824673 RepID=A0A8D5U7E2_9CREN|nr:hypothetical protein [Stygiolobus caldivivus]BCU70357.1 hypothetical protein KN1_16540 [Stygiolobus caldivivus]
MRTLKYIAISWTLWGISLYLFSPYLTILLESSISSPVLIGLSYIISSIVGVVLINLLRLAKNSNVNLMIKIPLVTSGVGLLIMGLINSPLAAVIGLVLYNSYWLSVPFFYYALSSAEKEQFSKTWAISMLPALVLPVIGGMIVLNAGVRTVFVISGAIMMLSTLPLNWVKLNPEGESFQKEDINLLPLIFSVFPLSLALPFLYEVKFFELSAVWLSYEIGEIVGIILTWVSWKSKNSLPISLLIFSTVVINSLVSVGGFYYGLSEAVLSTGVGGVNPRSFRSAIRVALTEASLWTIGYIVSSLAYIVSYSLPFIYAGLIAILFSLLLLMEVRSGKRPLQSLTSPIFMLVKVFEGALFEGIEPYFKFA